MVRVDEESGLGFALAADANGRYAQLDPYQGAQLALAEAYRNVAVTGAVPVAVSDCLNFGSPENPEVMWQFSRAVEGLSDGCLELEIPVTGGNVSFYNQTGDTPIHPTPVAAVLGVIHDVAARIPSGWQDEGNNIYLLGDHARRAGRLGVGGCDPRPPRRASAGRRPGAARRAWPALIAAGGSQSLIASAHDLSDGGLAQALAEAVLRFGVGARVWLTEIMERDGVDATAALFSESTGRVIVQRAARGRREVQGAVRGPRLPGAADRRDRRRAGRCQPGPRDPGPVHGRPRGTALGAPRHAAGTLRRPRHPVALGRRGARNGCSGRLQSDQN